LAREGLKIKHNWRGYSLSDVLNPWVEGR
jgi:hypothetical protein